MTRRASTTTRISVLLLCAVLALVNSIDLLGMEFGGGSLTGVLVRLCLGGSGLFMVCAVLAIMNPLLAALLSAIAVVACLPLYIQLIAPHALQWLSSAAASVQAPPVVFNDWAIIGILSLVVLGFVMVAAPGHGGPRRM